MHHFEFEVFLGIDVGKDKHYAVALDRSGARLLQRELPQDETRLRDADRWAGPTARCWRSSTSQTRSGRCRRGRPAEGIEVAYLPGLAMRRIADLHPGTAKTDARDAYVIADAARVMPHTLRRPWSRGGGAGRADGARRVRRRPGRGGHPVATTGCVGCSPRSTPPWNACWAASVEHPAALALLIKYGPTPAALRKSGAACIDRGARPAPAVADRSPTRSGRPGRSRPWSSPAPPPRTRSCPRLAAQLAETRDQRRQIAATGREGPRCAPSCRGPDLDARRRRQDRSPHPAPRSATAPRSPPQRTWPPTPAWHRSPTAPASPSAASTPPAAGTSASRARCSSGAFAALRATRISRAYYDRKRAERQEAQRRPASASPDAAATSCSPCSATAPYTPSTPRPLDNHIGTQIPEGPRCARRGATPSRFARTE